MAVTRNDIVAGLRRLGLAAGDKLMVHSSLRSFGEVEGAAETVLQALMDVLTEEGVLLLPSFNHGAPFRPEEAGAFDVRETPTSNGIIPETFRHTPGVWRSLDPTHAYCAWGRNAERFVNRHHLTLTMGPDSPQGMLQREGGYGLFLGTDYFSNTFKHVVEMSTGAPCLGRRTMELLVRLADGREVKLRTWGYRGGRCPISDPHEHIDAMMETAELHRKGMIGKSRVTLFRLQDCFNVLADMLGEGHAGFPPCRECPVRPASSDYDVETDWDEETQDLKPGSPSREFGPMAYRQPG